MITIRSLARIMLSFEALSNKKLQKLCYYAYAWYLAIFNRQLAPIQFEAWVHGPVSREVYNFYRSYGWEDIPQYYGFIIAEDNVIEFCRCIWEHYHIYSADELEQMTHDEAPWKNARVGYKPYESSNVVLKMQDIKEYYQAKLKESCYRNWFCQFIQESR